MSDVVPLTDGATDCPYKAYSEAWRAVSKIQDPERRALYMLAIADRIAMAHDLFDFQPCLPTDPPLYE